MKVLCLIFIALTLATLSNGQVWKPECATNHADPIKKYICEAIKNGGTYGDEICNPQFRPALNTATAKGLIVLFHGYSACPQQFNSIGYKLQEAGYDVFAPTLPGHGRVFVDGCQGAAVPNDCVLPGYDLRGVPTNHKGYDQFITTINGVVTQYAQIKKIPAMTGGLSVGGALATWAFVKGGKLYTAIQVWSGFYGITQPGADRTFWKCMDTKNNGHQCLKDVVFKPDASGISGKFGNALVDIAVKDTKSAGAEAYNYQQAHLRHGIAMAATPNPAPIVGGLIQNNKNFQAMVQNPFGWGAACEAARTQREHRGGFCGFKVQNLLGVHDLGAQLINDLAPKLSGLRGVRARFNLVERDGFQRNGLIWQIIQSFVKAGADVTADMFRMTCDDIFDNNNCGVPHASLGYQDNVNLPGGVYWLDGHIQQSVDWFTGAKKTIGSSTWNKDDGAARTTPFLLNVANARSADERLVANVPRLGLGTDITIGRALKAASFLEMSADTGVKAIKQRLLNRHGLGLINCDDNSNPIAKFACDQANKLKAIGSRFNKGKSQQNDNDNDNNDNSSNKNEKDKAQKPGVLGTIAQKMDAFLFRVW